MGAALYELSALEVVDHHRGVRRVGCQFRGQLAHGAGAGQQPHQRLRPDIPHLQRVRNLTATVVQIEYQPAHRMPCPGRGVVTGGWTVGGRR